MKRPRLLLLVLIVTFGLAGQLDTARAAITWSGDIDPADPTTWDSSTDGYVGKAANGTLEVNGDSDLLSLDGYIGYNSGATGQVTVIGSGSTWTNSDDLTVGRFGSGALLIEGGGTVNNDHCIIGYSHGAHGEVTVSGTGSMWNHSSYLDVGRSGGGTLNINNGGTVVVADKTTISRWGGAGTVVFGPGGGLLSTNSLIASPYHLTGTGTVKTRGLVSDVDLTFDTIASLTQTLHFDSEPGQDVTVNLDMSDPNNVGMLGAGYTGNGSVTIQDSVSITSRFGIIGYHNGSTGAVTVTGAGSEWVCHNYLHIGEDGNATLSILNGGLLRSSLATVAYSDTPSSTYSCDATATVSGEGSTWITYTLDVGNLSGSGKLLVTNGGHVSSSMYCQIGHSGVGAPAEATVSGAGSRWECNSFIATHDGILSITDGGIVSSASGRIGRYSGSIGHVIVSGAGSGRPVATSMSATTITRTPRRHSRSATVDL